MIKKYMLFYTPTCPKCPKIKDYMSGQKYEKEWVNAGTPEGLAKARELKVTGVPTVIFFDDKGKETARATNLEEVKRITENKTLV